MTTQYSPILKLALPVQGELSGTWGDVVNDNITSMVEQAIAGRAVINTWTTNSHSLTSANGTTSESRCAMLELTDTGTALSGAGTVICPALSKIYIVKNAAGQNITVKTASGTGILVPDGRTTFLFCDGTNVVEALTHTTSLQLGTSTTVTAVLDEDTMASDSPTSLATQQSIKAYVDSKVGQFDSLSEVLAVGNTTGSNNIIVDNGQKITTNTIDETTAGSGVTIDSVLLKDDVVNATDVETGTISANDGTEAATIANSTGVVTVPSAVLTTADINGGTADGVVIGGSTPAAATVTTATANTSLTIAGTVTVTSILDEDNMASNDPAGLATQQSIKTYVDAQVGTADVLSEVLANGNTTGGTDIAVSASDDITFTNTSKAIFGTGSSLEIYGDGSDSYVKDAGTGDLKIQGASVRLENPSGVRYFQGSSGNAYLYNSGDIKLDTTSTGVNVTGTITSDGLTVDGDITATGDTFSFTSANAEDPLVILKNTTNDANCARLRFVKDKGAAGVDGDDSGEIEFYADNDAQQQTLYARIKGEVQDASDGAEGGRFKFQVASHDGEMITALLLADGNLEDEVDVVIGSGSGSLTEVSGNLNVNGTVTSDGLSVEGDAVVSNGDTSVSAGDDFAKLQLKSVDSSTNSYGVMSEIADVAIADFNGASNDHKLVLRTNDGLAATGTLRDRVSIARNGNISFFEDQGSTAKFYWSAANESLGIGTDSPDVNTRLHIKDANTAVLRIEATGTDKYPGINLINDAQRYDFQIDGATDSLRIYDATNSVSRFVLDTSGNIKFDGALVQDGVKATTTATTQVAIETFAHASHDGAKVVITAATSADTYVTELLIATNGTTAVATEYGQIGTGSALATYDVDISGNDVRILATPASTTSTTFRVAMTLT